MSDSSNVSEMLLTLEECSRAFRNVEAAIDQGQRLPKNVFRSGWVDFHLFDSDWMFEGAFVEKVQTMLQHEGANCACLVNVSRDVMAASAIFVVDERTTAQDYQRRLAGAGPGDGWVYDIERFCCTSDIGSWCIYCERASELAIMGFRVGAMQKQYEFVLASLRASRVASVDASPRRFAFPSHAISSAWQKEIMRNYESG